LWIANFRCPILWKSQLQNKIALLATESEYTGLSYALRDAIPIMKLMKEMKKYNIPIQTLHARTLHHVFEDDSGAIKMANVFKYQQQKKHLYVRLHHFVTIWNGRKSLYITLVLITNNPIT
jgi:hypothetical protein